MIMLYTGTPGAGKSLHAARTIRRYLKVYKRDVIANFEVVTDDSWQGNFTYMPNSSITPGNLVDFACNYWTGRQFEEEGLLIVLDEAQLLFNSRLWSQDESRMEWLELMSQHRKYGMRIILICQADIMIDKQFRSLVEYEFNHRKMSNYGVLGLLVRYLAFGEIFYCCESLYAAKLKTGGEFFRYHKKIGSMYNSYKAFEQRSGVAKAKPATPIVDEDIPNFTDYKHLMTHEKSSHPGFEIGADMIKT